MPDLPIFNLRSSDIGGGQHRWEPAVVALILDTETIYSLTVAKDRQLVEEGHPLQRQLHRRPWVICPNS